ncbi:MAG: hypothetical protein RJB38_203, partial [Pseudomonadota bacterium]
SQVFRSTKVTPEPALDVSTKFRASSKVQLGSARVGSPTRRLQSEESEASDRELEWRWGDDEASVKLATIASKKGVLKAISAPVFHKK